MSTCFILTVEIELPGDLSDELQDAMVDDLTGDNNIERLRRGIKQWVRNITHEACHVSIDCE